MRKLLVFVIAAAVSALYGVSVRGRPGGSLRHQGSCRTHLKKDLSSFAPRHVEAAIEALEESVAIAPEAEAYYYLGYAYYLKGRSGDSESRKLSMESFEKAYELDPAFTPNKYKPPRLCTGVRDRPNATETRSPSLPPTPRQSANRSKRTPGSGAAAQQ